MIDTHREDASTTLTVGEAAEAVGVTVRTLHHWHQIGLAVPSRRSPAGYRLYDAGDLDRLRRIVGHRELGLELDDISRILDDPDVDVVESLRAQRRQLAQKRETLAALDREIARMIAAHERGVLLDDGAQQELFGSGWDPAWPAQARERYGDTAQWRRFAERSAKRGSREWAQVQAETRAADEALARACAAGIRADDPAIDPLVEQHRRAYSAYFPISRSMHVCLGRMYESTPDFASHYEALHAGLTAWLRHAIDETARRHGLEPDAATWE